MDLWYINFWNIWERESPHHELMEYNLFKDNSSKREKKRDKWISIYLYLGLYTKLQTYSTMSEVTLHNYLMNLSLMKHQATTRVHKSCIHIHPRNRTERDMYYLIFIRHTNHRVEDMQKFHFKTFSAISYMMIKRYFSFKWLNQQWWYIQNQIIYHMKRSKNDKYVLTYEESHYNT